MTYRPLTSEPSLPTFAGDWLDQEARWGMSMTGRTLVALAGAALVLVFANWFDNTFMRDAVRYVGRTFDYSGLGVTFMLGAMLVAGSVLFIGALAWRAASVVVGLTFGVVGGFFVALPQLFFNFATQVNDVPPVLPEPLSSALQNIYFTTSDGPMHAVGTIGAAMLIAGIAALARWWRGRSVASSRAEVVVPTADPMLP